MGKRQVCRGCGRVMSILARGLCGTCYGWWRAGRPLPLEGPQGAAGQPAVEAGVAEAAAGQQMEQPAGGAGELVEQAGPATPMGDGRGEALPEVLPAQERCAGDPEDDEWRPYAEPAAPSAPARAQGRGAPCPPEAAGGGDVAVALSELPGHVQSAIEAEAARYFVGASTVMRWRLCGLAAPAEARP